MSVLKKYAQDFRDGNRGRMYAALQELDAVLDAIDMRTGAAQKGKVDNPGTVAQTVGTPPQVSFTVTRHDTNYLVSITNPQNLAASSPSQRLSQNQNGLNSPNVLLYHQLQSASDASFGSNVDLVDYGSSPQTSFSVPNTGRNKFWRLRSSYDGKTWNAWKNQAPTDGLSAGSGIALEVNGVANSSQELLNLQGPVKDLGNGNVEITASGLPIPSDKRFVLWTGAGSSDNPFFSVLGDQLTYIANSLNVSGQSPTADQSARVAMTISGSALNGSAQFWGRSIFYTGRKCVLEARVRAIQGTANMRCWIGLWSGLGNSLMFNPNPLIMGQSLIGFKYYAAEAPNWQCDVCNAVAETLSDSGVAFSTTNTQVLRIELNGTAALFYINGQLLRSVSTYYPPNAGLGLVVTMQGLTGIVGNGMSIEYVYGECDVP